MQTQTFCCREGHKDCTDDGRTAAKTMLFVNSCQSVLSGHIITVVSTTEGATDFHNLQLELTFRGKVCV